jgi:hypothetical protein
VNDIAQEQNFVRKLYRDIINGFSIIHRNEKIFAFKHLSEAQICETSEVYINKFYEVKGKGLLCAEEKIKLLCEQKVWSEDKENEIKRLQQDISINRVTLKKLIINSQVTHIKNIIKEKEFSLNTILQEKDELLELTAEKYAYKKSNEYIIYLSLFQEDLKAKLFKSEEEFLELKESDLIDYIYAYKEFIEILKIENIKKVAVSAFFMNNFFLCEDNPYTFYGKSVTELTQYQSDLFSLGRNYKSHLTKGGENPPDNFKSLDDLVAWYENRSNLSALKDKNQDKMGQSFIGASKEEMKSITSDSKEEVLDLSVEAKKAGGDLSFDQILKIHGI